MDTRSEPISHHRKSLQMSTSNSITKFKEAGQMHMMVKCSKMKFNGIPILEDKLYHPPPLNGFNVGIGSWIGNLLAIGPLRKRLTVSMELQERLLLTGTGRDRCRRARCPVWGAYDSPCTSERIIYTKLSVYLPTSYSMTPYSAYRLLKAIYGGQGMNHCAQGRSAMGGGGV